MEGISDWPHFSGFLIEMRVHGNEVSHKKFTLQTKKNVFFEVFTAVTMKNVVFWDIKTQFVLHRRHVTSPLQSPAS
jgi:hypothetical protein